MSFVLVGLGLLIALIGVALWNGLRTARDWTSVEGEIIDARIVGNSHVDGAHTHTDYSATLRYRYTVNGVELVGSRRQLVSMSTLSYGYAKGVADRYPVGRRVAVFYDPDNPTNAALEIPTNRVAPWLLLLAGAAVAGFGVYWGFWLD